MPGKTRQRRVKIARRQGKTTAIKESDVGLASGLSRHAAKKSRHVVGMHSPRARSASLKQPPGLGKNRRATTEEGDLVRMLEELVADRMPSAGRVAGIERGRSVPRTLSRRSPSRVAAKQQRLRS
jgi:hypothetical protein